MALLIPLADPHVHISSGSLWCQTASWAQDFTSRTRGPFSISGWCLLGGSSATRHVSPGPSYGRKANVERLWREFFIDPSQWWDHRSEKISSKYPDFKHKKTQQSLWLDNKFTPPWVEAELAVMAPDTLQLDIFSWNLRLGRYVKAGDYMKSIECFHQILGEGMNPDKFTFLAVLKACSSLRSLDEGMLVHEQVIKRGYECNIFVGSCLVDMYAKCGSIYHAWTVFNKMPRRNVVAWSAMILGYVKCGAGQKALELYHEMQREGVDPNPVTFIAVLNACASIAALEEGRRVHEEIIQRGYECDAFVGSCLVDMYGKCGSIEDAREVFNKMPTRDVVAWSAMILGYVKCREGQMALEVYRQMCQEGVDPNPVTFVAVLNACASIMALEEGRRVHEQIIGRGYACDVFVGSSLVDMFCKCGSLVDAQSVFNKMPRRNVVAWSAMILGYVKYGEGQTALELYRQMRRERVDPDLVTFVAVLNACASVAALEEGKCVHDEIIERGYESNVFVGSSLVDMYAKCGSMEYSWRVFNKMTNRDVGAWSAVIMGYVKSGAGQKALELYREMQQEGVDPNPATFVAVLNACSSVAALDEGKRVHGQIIERGYGCDVFVSSCLVHMYAKCGSITDAQGVFNKMATTDVVAWTAMMLGYVKCGEGQTAIELYRQMQQEGVDPDPAAFVAVLNACASIGALEEGRHVHEQIIEKGYQYDVFVGNSLVDMYAKCASIVDARRVFNNMPTRNAISWNALLAGYGRHGFAEEALDHFEQMCKAVEVNDVAFLSLLSACSHGGLVDEGLHYFRLMSTVFNIPPTVEHYSCVVDLLGRAGRLREAEDLIRSMPCKQDATLWMSLLSACRGFEAVEMSERVAKRVLELDPGNCACYVLLSNIYAAAGKWDSSERVQQKRLEQGVTRLQGVPGLNDEMHTDFG